MRTSRKVACAVVLGLAATALLVAHEGHKGLEAKGVRVMGALLILDERTERALGISTALAREGSVEDSLPVSARIVPAPGARSFASARLAGVVTSVKCAVGDRVRAGDVLAVVDSIDLESLALQWNQAQDDLATAEADLKRAEAASPAILPEQEIESLRGIADDRRISLEAALQKMRIAGVEDEAIGAMRAGGPAIRQLKILAAGDGVCVHVDVTQGQIVVPELHLFEIVDDAELWVEGWVPEYFAADAQAGRAARASFEALPGLSFTVSLARVAARVDAATRTLSVAAKIGRSEGLRPGTPGRLDLIRRSASGVLVPRGAVARQGIERFAFVSLGSGRYRRQPVTPGARSGSDVEIPSGIKAGDAVVVNGARELASLFVQGVFEIHADALVEHGVRIAEADLSTVEPVIRLSATMRAPPGTSAFVASLAHGKVRRVFVFEGDRVEAGTPLAEVESVEVRGDEVELIRAATRIALLDKRAGFLRELEKKGISARKELLRLEAELRAERLAALALKAKLTAVGVPADEVEFVQREGKPGAAVTLRSAIAGVIVASSVAPGQVVEARERLFEIANTAVLRAEGVLPESRLVEGVPARGAKAVLRPAAWPGLGWSTEVSGIAPGLGAGNALFVWADVLNPGGQLREGMVAELVVETGAGGGQVIAVSEEALWPSSGSWYVFLQEGETFRRQRVVPGRRGARDVEIVQGLYPGDRVAVSALDELNLGLSAVK
ncbi:MAG: cobalt-zinc-cadmium resistance protein [Planctomycetota bacterium]|nr:MAG: cobalt-zinc-cadmium resistance protein [Planctomycetota bacterium]